MATRRLPSAGFSITIRVNVTADPYAVGRLTTAVGEAGGIVTALDLVDSDPANLVVDVTCDTADAAHAAQVTQALEDPAVAKAVRATATAAHALPTAARSATTAQHNA